MPYVLVDLVTTNYPQLATAFMANIVSFIFFFGGMIVASSTLEAIHRPGTYLRLMFGLTALAFLCMWIFVIFGGGIAEIDYGPYHVRFDMSKILYIMLIGVSLKGLLVYSTFSTSRKAEIKRARIRRVEEAKKRTAGSKPRPAAQPSHADVSFAQMARAEFDVTADDAVGFASAPPERHLEPGMKLCEVCGAKAPVKDYVCKGCGAWFPKDSVIRE